MGQRQSHQGAIGHPTTRCTNASCRPVNDLLKKPRVVLTAKPYKGWKFTGWRRACKTTKKPVCVLDASHGRKDIFGGHSVWATATFVPVAIGLTRAHPIPLGTAASIIEGFVVRVNSANENVQLGTPPPAGAEYFDANLTATNTGGRLSNLSLVWGGPHVAGSHGHARYYTQDGHGCSDPAHSRPWTPSTHSTPASPEPDTSAGRSRRTTQAALSCTSARGRSTLPVRPGSHCTSQDGQARA